MTPMEKKTEHHFGPFWRRILGLYPAAPSSPGPFVLLLKIVVCAKARTACIQKAHVSAVFGRGYSGLFLSSRGISVSAWPCLQIPSFRRRRSDKNSLDGGNGALVIGF